MFRRLLLIALVVSFAAACGCSSKEGEKTQATPMKNRMVKPDGVQ